MPGHVYLLRADRKLLTFFENAIFSTLEYIPSSPIDISRSTDVEPSAKIAWMREGDNSSPLNN